MTLDELETRVRLGDPMYINARLASAKDWDWLRHFPILSNTRTVCGLPIASPNVLPSFTLQEQVHYRGIGTLCTYCVAALESPE
ncbi:MAG: hypothetical protein ACTSX8_03590 [Alphaproteobacteria bacterium]